MGFYFKYFKRAAYTAALFISIFTSADAGRTSELQLALAAGNVYGCSISADGAGNVFAAWTDDTGSAVPSVFGKVSRNFGKDWEKTLCFSGKKSVSGGPKTACRNGIFHAVWTELDSTGVIQAFYARSTGAGWSVPARLSNNGCIAGSALVAAEASGAVHAAWMSSMGICAVRSPNGGLQWSDSAVVVSNALSVESLSAGSSGASLCWLAGTPASVYLARCFNSWSLAAVQKVSENLSPENASLPVFGAGLTAWRQSGGAGEDVLICGVGGLSKLSSGAGTVNLVLPFTAQDGTLNVLWQRNVSGVPAFFLSSCRNGGNFSQETKEFELSGITSISAAAEAGMVYIFFARAASVSFQIFDKVPPSIPVISSPTHNSALMSSNNCPEFGANSMDGGSAGAVAGYGLSIDNIPSSEAPFCINNLDGRLSCKGLNSQTWYFHARAFDLAGNFSPTFSYRISIAAAQFLPADEYYIYPNPARTSSPAFRFFSACVAEALIEIFDDSGRMQLSARRQALQGVNTFLDIDISGLSNGVYMSRLRLNDPISGSNTTVVKKFVVAR